MLGYSITGHDNDSYAFYGREDVLRCPDCGNLTRKWEESLAGLRIRKRRAHDISATYDGVLVVSNKFVQICREYGFRNAIFRQLPDDPAFYEISSNLIVKFDAERRHTRFEGLCSTCKQYNSVTGATPVMLCRKESIPERSFAQTDIEFGSGDERHPIVLCDTQAGEVLIAGQLKGLETTEIASCSKTLHTPNESAEN